MTTDDARRRWTTRTTQESGIAASDVSKLRDAGVHTVEGLAAASRKHLQSIKGLSEQKVEKLKQAGAGEARGERTRTRTRTREGSGFGARSARATREVPRLKV
jgi:DNA-binding Xre family transcriptional regulator